MTHELVLYKYDACPYCHRVQSWLDGRDVPVVFRDTRQDPQAREELLALTGRTQVPCLVIDGTPMFESDDIVDWLQDHYGEPVPAGRTAGQPRAPQPRSLGRRARILRRLKRG